MQPNVHAVLSRATSGTQVVANLIRKPESCAMCGAQAQAGSNYAICPDCYKVNGSFFSTSALPGEDIRAFSARRKLARAMLRGVAFEKFPRSFNLAEIVGNDRLPFRVRERAAAQLARRQPKPQPAYQPTARDRKAASRLAARFIIDDSEERFVENLLREEDPTHPLYDPSDSWELDADVRRPGRSAVLVSRSFFGSGVLEKHDVDAEDREAVERLAHDIRSALPQLNHRAHTDAINRWLKQLRTRGRKVPVDDAALTAVANAPKRHHRIYIGRRVDGQTFCSAGWQSSAPLETALSSSRYGRTLERGDLRLSDAALV